MCRLISKEIYLTRNFLFLDVEDKVSKKRKTLVKSGHTRTKKSIYYLKLIDELFIFFIMFITHYFDIIIF